MFQKIIDWYYYQKAKRKLMRTKKEDLAVFGILEEYLTEIILDGQQQRRPELADIQRKIEEVKKFIEFLKKI